MSCHVCARASHPHVPFYCPTCARNQLYQRRIDGTRGLLEKEVLGREIETAVACKNYPDESKRLGQGSSDTSSESSRRWVTQAIATKEALSESRREALARHIEDLKLEIKNKEVDIQERKASLSRRRSDAESAEYQLADREAGILTSMRNTTKRTQHLWHSLHSKTAEARIFLCREAANLYGLRQKSPNKRGSRESYGIGGVSIIDLRDMNGKSTATLNPL